MTTAAGTQSTDAAKGTQVSDAEKQAIQQGAQQTDAEKQAAADKAAADQKAADDKKAADDNAAADKKAADDKAAADKKAADEKAAAEAKPLTKTDIKIGDDSPLSSEEVEGLISFANEKKLSKELTQALVEREAAQKTAQAEAVEKAKDKWLDDVKNDKELGGDNLKETSVIVKKVFDRFQDPELKAYLENTGLGNHPAVVRFIKRIGKSMTSEQLVIPAHGGDKPEPVSAAAKLYDNTPAET